MTFFSAQKAASAQKKAADQAAAAQKEYYGKSETNLRPYMEGGQIAQKQLTARTGELTSRFNPQNLENNPGYQFAKNEGLKSLASYFGSRGLAESGASQKGAAEYATGLASKTYLDMANLDLAQKGQEYSVLQGQINTAANAANQLSAFGTQTGTNIGNTFTAKGNADAAAAMAFPNMLTSLGSAFLGKAK